MWVSNNKYKIVLVLLGISLRLLIMPFTMHFDLLCTARRASILLFDNIFLLPNLAEFTYTAILLPFKSTLTNLPNILPMDIDSSISITPNQNAYVVFTQSEQIYRTLFLLKLPFLLTDLSLLALIITKLKKGVTNLFFWSFNPFVLYSVYMIGRYEIFPILFAFLSFIYAKKVSKRERYLSVLFMGIAIAFRISFLIYLPFLLIYLTTKIKDFVLMLFTSSMPYIFFAYLINTLGGFEFKEQYANTMFTANVGEGFYSVNPFLVLYSLAVYNFAREKLNAKLNYGKFIAYSSIAVLSYYAFSIFYPQYIAWLVPIGIILVDECKKLIYSLFVLFVPLFLLFDAYYGCYHSACLLFESLNMSFAHSFYSLKNQLLDIVAEPVLLNIIHTIFLITVLYNAYSIKKSVYEKK